MQTWLDKQCIERGEAMLQHASIFMSYVNYRGREGSMNLKPLELLYAATEWHPYEQWLLRALNTDRNVMRQYALQDVLWWRCTDAKCSFSCRLRQLTSSPNDINEVRLRQFNVDTGKRF